MSFIDSLRDGVRTSKRAHISLGTVVTIAALVFSVYRYGIDGIIHPSRVRSSPTRGVVTPAPVAPDGTVLVAHAVDGDTVVLEGGETVRYLGIDTPETVDPRKPVQCFGPEASQANHALVDGKRVRLERDIEDRDKYGRLLRFVYLADGTLVNLALVERGFAAAYTYPPNVAHAEEFHDAARAARQARRGLWATCTGVRTDRGAATYQKLKRSH